MGTLTLHLSGRNLPISRFVAKLKPSSVSLLRLLMVVSRLPKPGVGILPASDNVPRSASLAVTLLIAAQPPFSLKSVIRNSSNHTSVHLGKPSSDPTVAAVFFGFR